MFTEQELKAGEKVVTEKIGPVRIQRVRRVGVDNQTVQVQVQQFTLPTTGNPLLSLTMMGHSSFNSKRSRVAWQNFHVTQVEKMNLPGLDLNNLPKEGFTFSPENPELCPVFTFPRPNAEDIEDPAKRFFKTCIVERDSFTPRTYLDGNGVMQSQAPKKAGADGENLTYNGQMIYRNTFLAFEGLDDKINNMKWNEDFIINHNNVVEGSIRRAAREAVDNKEGVGVIQLPGGELREVTAEGIMAPGASATGRTNIQAYGQGAGLGKENQPATTSSSTKVIDLNKNGEQIGEHMPPAYGSAQDAEHKQHLAEKGEQVAELQEADNGGGETRNPEGSFSAESQEKAAEKRGHKNKGE